MRDSNEAQPAAGSCRSCGHALARSEYQCPSCDTPHLPHLQAALAGPFLKMLAFALVIAGPIAAYTFYEAVVRFAAKV